MGPPTIELLSQRLREAVAWCNPRVNIAAASTCLRTLPYTLYPFCSRYFLVEEVAIERAKRLGTWGVNWRNDFQNQPRLTARDLHGGRILVFEPDCYLHEQLEQAECDDFLDTQATPPTDSWLVYLDEVPGVVGGAVLSWVPAAFVEGVQRAMQVNTTECLLWLEDAPGALARIYKRCLV